MALVQNDDRCIWFGRAICCTSNLSTMPRLAMLIMYELDGCLIDCLPADQLAREIFWKHRSPAFDELHELFRAGLCVYWCSLNLRHRLLGGLHNEVADELEQDQREEPGNCAKEETINADLRIFLK